MLRHNNGKCGVVLLAACCWCCCAHAQVEIIEQLEEASPEVDVLAFPESPAETFDIGLGCDDVTIPPGLRAFDAIAHIFSQIPLQLNYLELLSTNHLARLRAEPSTFHTSVPAPWDVTLREVIRPYSLGFIENGDVVRLGHIDEIDRQYLLLEQEQLRNNHKRVEFNFSEGVQLYVALRAIQSEAGINMNFDYMEAKDRGIVQDQELTAGTVAEAQPQGPLTTYATPANQPVEWRIAMNEVLNPHKYGFIEENGVVRPMKFTRMDQWKIEQIDAKPLVTRVVRIHHVDPSELITSVEGMGLLKHSQASIKLAHGWESMARSIGGGGMSGGSGGGGGSMGSGAVSIERHYSPPAVIIRDIEENIDTVLKEVRALDAPDPQIMIEVRILDLGKDSNRKLGVLFDKFGGDVSFGSQYASSYSRGRSKSRSRLSRSYSGSDTAYSSNDENVRDQIDMGEAYGVEPLSEFGLSRPAMVTPWDIRDSGATDVTYNNRNALRDSLWGRSFDLILNPFQMQATWDMLQTAQDAKIVSQPVLVVPDNAEAMIVATRLEPYYTETDTTDRSGGGTSTTISGSWEEEEIGTKLNVIPEITADGKSVRLTVLPVVSELVGYAQPPPLSRASRKPIESRRMLDTRVTVHSGHTLLIGGLISSRSNNEENKVPFFGDLPVVGSLFRHTDKDKTGQTLIMLITPTILDDETPETGYESAVVPHFEKLKTDMNTTLLTGMDEAMLQAMEDRARRSLVEDTEPSIQERPVLGPEMNERIQAIDAELMQELE